jgi:hypothetical protein
MIVHPLTDVTDESGEYKKFVKMNIQYGESMELSVIVSLLEEKTSKSLVKTLGKGSVKINHDIFLDKARPKLLYRTN